MITLALDLGTLTGWALDRDGVLTSGIWNLRGGRYEGGGMRYVRLENYIRQMAGGMACFDRVYFEEVRRHQGVDAAHVYGGCLAVVSAYCERYEVAYAGIPVQTIKKFATGSGNASKDAMIEAAVLRWPLQDIPDLKQGGDNQADALWLLATAGALYSQREGVR